MKPHRSIMIAALEECGTVTAAAEALGYSARQLQRWLRRDEALRAALIRGREALRAWRGGASHEPACGVAILRARLAREAITLSRPQLFAVLAEVSQMRRGAA